MPSLLWTPTWRGVLRCMSCVLDAASIMEGDISTYALQKSKFFLDSVCVSHVTNMIEGKTYRVTAREPDQNKSTKRESESTTRKPWASLWPLASPTPRPHVFQLDKFVRHILGGAVCTWFGRK